MIGIIIGVFLVGWAARSRIEVPARVLSLADSWVLRIALPAMVVSTMARIEIGADLVVPIASAWGVMALCAAVIALVCRRAGWTRETTGALLLVGVLGNTSFLGLGMTEGLLGREHLFAAVAYDQPGTFLALATWGALVASRWGSGGAGWRPVVTRLVTFPPFIALLVSIPVRRLSPPEPVWGILDALARTVAPVAMAAVGLRFVPRLRGIGSPPVLVGVAVKMVLAPAAVALAAVLAGAWGETAWESSILQAAAPPMASAGLLAVAAGLDEDVSTTLVGLGTLAAFAWVPLVSLLL